MLFDQMLLLNNYAPTAGCHATPLPRMKRCGETKLELPLREAPCSLSIGLDLDHELLGLISSKHS